MILWGGAGVRTWGLCARKKPLLGWRQNQGSLSSEKGGGGERDAEGKWGEVVGRYSLERNFSIGGPQMAPGGILTPLPKLCVDFCV